MKAGMNDIKTIKEKLTFAAKSAENPGNLLGEACWGYFAADVLRLIEDHSKIQAALSKSADDRVAIHSVD